MLFECYGKLVPIQLADSELQLGAEPTTLTICPTLYWNERGANFIVSKFSNNCYRSQFFYSDADQYGTGKDKYNDLERCGLTLLRVQSDHERQLSNISSGTTAANFKDVDYHGPLII